MIVYNVTISIDESVRQEWVEWMKNEHIPEVLATGMFLGAKMFYLLTNAQDDNGHNYTVQYTCESLERFREYEEKYAPALGRKTEEKFGGKFYVFRSIMEEV
ncbi:MAG: DUF4286 family protein [Cytophagales bacterium]|nr:DUF4286 family protein [Bernardetiaceae bacterium]MDW8211038.1 DUF4286 family protein [Cytophagales bacterium]